MSWDISSCPNCGTSDCVPPYGRKLSKVLVVGAFPGEEEIRQMRPFVGKSGGILRNELSRLGVDLDRLRLCNLWLHTPNNLIGCLQQSMDVVREEAKGKRIVLLIGSEPSRAFVGYGDTEVNGLVLKSEHFECPVVVCVQPVSVFHGGVGELRFALKNFVDEAKKVGAL